MRKEIALALLASAVDAAAAEHVIDQKDKRFNTTELRIKTGDTIKFVNSDSFFHNVFSLSDTKTFDLGSYPKGQSRTVKFDKPGEVEIECAIHPEMKLRVRVEK